MIVDAYPHLYPKEYLKAVHEAFPNPSVQFHLSHPRFYDPEFRIKIMDKFKIDIQVINVAGGLPVHEISSPLSQTTRESPKLARLANDEVAKIVQRYPGRFFGVALLPHHKTDETLDELERCINDLGLKGVCIWSGDIPTSMDSRDLDPLYERMVKYDLPILIHPSFGSYVKEPGEFAVGYSLGWPFETAMAMARLVYGGVLERFPAIKFITHHTGSMIPYFGQRIKMLYEAALDGSHGPIDRSYRRRFKKNPVEYFKLFYNDTAVSGSHDSLILARSFFGHERILFGTDYPYGPMSGEEFFRLTLDSVERAVADTNAKNEILGKNASVVFRLP